MKSAFISPRAPLSSSVCAGNSQRQVVYGLLWGRHTWFNYKYCELNKTCTVGLSVWAERQRTVWLKTSRLLENIQRFNRGFCVIWLDSNKLHSFPLHRSPNYVSLQNLVNRKTGRRFTEFGDSPEHLGSSKLSPWILCFIAYIYNKYCNILIMFYIITTHNIHGAFKIEIPEFQNLGILCIVVIIDWVLLKSSSHCNLINMSSGCCCWAIACKIIFPNIRNKMRDV